MMNWRWDRRRALQSMVVAAASVPMANVRASDGRPNNNLDFGLILKMKEDLATDWKKALGRVAALGVRQIEFADFVGPSAQACRVELDRLRLIALGGGDVYRRLNEDLDRVAQTANILGKRYVYCYWPWLDGGKHKTADDWKRLADTLNAMGKRVKASGLILSYHNHDMEFVPIGEGGPLPYDVLLENTDPALMTMQMDLWWVEKSGQSPLPILQRHPGRFASFHIKERLNTPDAKMVCSGESFAGLQAILQAGIDIGVRHFVVENENPTNHYRCAEQTLGYLRTLKLQTGAPVSGAVARGLTASGAKLVDVRSPEEFAEGHLPGAINIPLPEIEGTRGCPERLLDVGETVVLYCRTGRRSALAAELLRRSGHAHVFDLGGKDRW